MTEHRLMLIVINSYMHFQQIKSIPFLAQKMIQNINRQKGQDALVPLSCRVVAFSKTEALATADIVSTWPYETSQ